MDPRVVAERKGVAMARIESALDVLTNQFGLTSSAVDGLRRNYADPNVTDLYRVEGIADLIENLLVLAQTKVPVAKAKKRPE